MYFNSMFCYETFVNETFAFMGPSANMKKYVKGKILL